MRVKAVDRLKEKKKEKVTTPQCTLTLARELLEDISEDRRDTARKKEQGGGKRETAGNAGQISPKADTEPTVRRHGPRGNNKELNQR